MIGDYLAALDMHDLDTSAIYGEEYFASEITFLSLSIWVTKDVVFIARFRQMVAYQELFHVLSLIAS